MKKKSTALSTLLVLALSTGASQAENAPVTPAVPTTAHLSGAAEVKSPNFPAAATKGAPKGAAKAKPVDRADDLSGKVLEVTSGGGYTFFQLEKDGQKFWAATPPTEAKVGDVISLQPGIEMSKFKSKSLDRTFEQIYFSGGKVQPAGTPPDSDYVVKKAHSMKPPAVTGTTDGKGESTQPLVTGKILEKLDGGGYSYFLLEKEGKKTWVATPPTEGKVGDTVSFSAGMEMKDFKSKALDRTFDSIIFTDGVAKGASKAMVPKGEAKDTAKAGKPLDVKVAKADAPNGYTVGELYNKSGDLNGKEVVVQGRVVKVSKQIMGKNWVHLQDGSGDAATGSNNLVTTTQDLAVVGDLVVATGKLAKDKDFGGGYQYAVIIEETKLVQK
jgi:hypothetical protein